MNYVDDTVMFVRGRHCGERGRIVDRLSRDSFEVELQSGHVARAKADSFKNMSELKEKMQRRVKRTSRKPKRGSRKPRRNSSWAGFWAGWTPADAVQLAAPPPKEDTAGDPIPSKRLDFYLDQAREHPGHHRFVLGRYGDEYYFIWNDTPTAMQIRGSRKPRRNPKAARSFWAHWKPKAGSPWNRYRPKSSQMPKTQPPTWYFQVGVSGGLKSFIDSDLDRGLARAVEGMEREPHRSIGVWPADEMGRPDPESGSVLNTYVGEYLEEMARPTRNAKRPVVRVFIRKEPESYSATGFAYRAYRADDGSPMLLGAETLTEAKDRVRHSLSPFRVAKFVPEPVKRNSSPAEDRLSAARTKAMHRGGGYLPQGDCDFCGARSGAAHHADCPVVVPWWTVTEHIEGSAIPGGFPAHEARTAVQAVTARGAVAAARRHRGLEPANEVEPTGQMRQDRLTGRSTQVWLVNGRRVRVEAHDGWKDMQHRPAKGTGA